MATLHISQGCVYPWNWGHRNGRGKIMRTNSVLPCLARLYKRIIPQGGHNKFGFGNGRITNTMAIDGGSLSKVTIIPRCDVQ